MMDVSEGAGRLIIAVGVAAIAVWFGIGLRAMWRDWQRMRNPPEPPAGEGEGMDNL